MNGERPRAVAPHHLRAVRLGHGGNCSSVGSVVDTLFVGAVAGTAIFVAVCAAMKNEPIRVVGEQQRTADTEASDATASEDGDT